jgi:hypothetical protein
MQDALAHLRELIVLETRAIAAETQVISTATLEAAGSILQQLEASMEGE